MALERRGKVYPLKPQPNESP